MNAATAERADLSAVFGIPWAQLQQHHHELPAVTFRLVDLPKTLARANAPSGWSHRENLAVEFTPAGLGRPAEQVFATLIHEAAHMLDWARWGWVSGHRERFRGFARDLGLNTWPDFDAADAWRNTRRRWPTLTDDQITVKVERRLWREVRYSTTISDELRSTYAESITAIAATLPQSGGVR